MTEKVWEEVNILRHQKSAPSSDSEPADRRTRRVLPKPGTPEAWKKRSPSCAYKNPCNQSGTPDLDRRINP